MDQIMNDSNMNDIKPVRSLIDARRDSTEPKVRARHQALFEFLTTAPRGLPGGDTAGGVGEINVSGDNPYIEVSDTLANGIGAKRLVIRDCYNHLLPLFLNSLGKGERAVLEGTPGVGKTLFGLVLLKEILLKNRDSELHSPTETVVYWDHVFATAVSFSEVHKIKYGLDQQFNLNGEDNNKLYMGSWRVKCQDLDNFLADSEIWVVHDPAEGFTAAGFDAYATSTAIILSFGHALVSLWNRKGHKPATSLYMPCFEKQEILSNKANLFYDRDMEWKQQVDSKVEILFAKFGGSIRHWGRQTEDAAWKEIEAKIVDVVNKNGAQIATRTVDHRGSVLHVQVDFDNTKPTFPSPNRNTFQDTRYVLGSDRIADKFATVFQERSTQEMKDLMRLFSSEKGVEAVYGVFFEKYAHRLLRDSCATTTELNLRVARRDGKNKKIYASTRITVQHHHFFPGRDYSILTDLFQNNKLEMGSYLQPESSSFPTYDAIAIVPGESVGMTGKKVALLLQMTVSGASGLRRLPKHAVKNHIRQGIDRALRNAVKDFTDADVCVTTFCVPTVCFQPFLFQLEEKKDSEAAMVQGQPEFQFVVEIPDFIKLEPVSCSLNEIHGASGRMHRYELRSELPTKVQKTETLHVFDD